MPVVRSQIVQDAVFGGVRRVEERHVDHLGRVRYCSSEASIGADVQAIMLARIPSLEAAQAEQDAIPEPLPEQPQVILGQGVPSFPAPEGQFYLDTNAFDLYVRSGGAW